jgi:hypothetical protein
VKPPPSLKYLAFLERYQHLKSANDRMKSAMTDIAFEMTEKVWKDLRLDSECRGDCFFCIGGVNAINPFSATAVKNEIAVYAEAISKKAKSIDPKEGKFYDMSGNSIEKFDLSGYDEIYMDFNGSMAFFNEDWQTRLGEPDIVVKVNIINISIFLGSQQSQYRD